MKAETLNNIPVDGWVPVKGFEGLYEIHPDGIVRSLDREILTSRWALLKIPGRIITPETSVAGYRNPVYNLYKNDKRTRRSVAVLMRQHFPKPDVPPEPEERQRYIRNRDPYEIRLIFRKYLTAGARCKSKRLKELCEEYKFCESTFWWWKRKYNEMYKEEQEAVAQQGEDYDKTLRQRAQALLEQKQRERQLRGRVSTLRTVRH